MKVKFNKFERVAGLFVLSTIFSGLAMLVGIAIKQGWFETKIRFETTLTNADGVHVGTLVQMAGLRAGSVISVELRSNHAVHVALEISEKYHDLVREDSNVRTLRPFIISEKIVDISVGDKSLPMVADRGVLNSEETADIMDFVSGRSLAPYFHMLSKMGDNLRFVAEAFLDPQRTKDFVRIFDEMRPLVINMNSMASQVSDLVKDTNKDKKLVKLVDALKVTTGEVNKLLPEMNKIMPILAQVTPQMLKDSPKLAADMAKIAGNLAILTDELHSTLPAFKELMTDVAPEVPRAGRRAMEALDETVVTLKALQKSFLLRSNAREVRDEEAEREKIREPANKIEKAP
jgi:phospholipid/cholesterol/gamma-HCH transport system substrate-binding protein